MNEYHVQMTIVHATVVLVLETQDFLDQNIILSILLDSLSSTCTPPLERQFSQVSWTSPAAWEGKIAPTGSILSRGVTRQVLRKYQSTQHRLVRGRLKYSELPQPWILWLCGATIVDMKYKAQLYQARVHFSDPWNSSFESDPELFFQIHFSTPPKMEQMGQWVAGIPMHRKIDRELLNNPFFYSNSLS